jgi:dephospho-CoA kinase
MCSPGPEAEPVVILGLTGSIGMGKSTTADLFRSEGVPVHDADAAVHAMTAHGGEAVAAVAAAFPGIVTAGAVDRTALGARVFDDPAALRRLEAILHPLVRKRETRFLLAAARRHCPLVVLDIPLLFETGGETRCDAVVVVTAPAFVQRRRVLSRPGVTPARFEAILRRQVPDCEKRRRADFIVPTGLGVAFSLRAVRKIVTVAQTIRARRWPG